MPMLSAHPDVTNSFKKICLVISGSPAWEDPYTQAQEVQRIVLPTAPRAARAGAVDLSQLPKGPPYTAFLGNLPYGVEEEDIFQFFQSVQVHFVFIFFKSTFVVIQKYCVARIIIYFI